MVILSKIERYLPADTELLVAIKPEGQLSPELRQHIENHPEIQRPQHGFVRVRLLKELKITFKLYSTGNIKKELVASPCLIPALPNEDIQSLNQAYQKISAAYETKRASVGGRVYDSVYYQANNQSWTLLGNMRRIIYRQHKVEFENRAAKIKGTHTDGMCPPMETASSFGKIICR